jgi:hypothetical protein
MAIEDTSRSQRRRWTEEEDALVVEALRRHNKLQDVVQELDGQLDRSWGAIMNRARILVQRVPEFRQASPRRRWTVEHDQYLRENWGKRSPEQIAEHLGRSVGAIKMRVSVLGFGRRRRGRKRRRS